MRVAVLALSFSACGGGSDGGSPSVFTLSVQKLGSGSGTVSGGAVSCGATCSASLDSGTAVTLTASAGAGSTFAGWGGCDGTSGATCNVTMNADRTVSATFVLGAGSLAVVNATSHTIAELYASPAGAGTWGANRLAAAILPAGTSTLSDFPAGTYDLRAVASDGFSHWQTNAATITDGGLFTWTLQPPDLGSLSVVNNHCIAVDRLYVRPSSLPAWSASQLSSPVAPGGTITLAALPAGTYDVSALALDGNSWTVNGIAVTVGGTYTWAVYMPANTGCLRLTNNADTGSTVQSVWAPPSSPSTGGCAASAWGAELLAGQTIAPDASFTFSNLPGGPHDILVLTSESTERYQFCGVSIPAGGTTDWYLVAPN